MIEWLQGEGEVNGKYYLRSACGRFSVSKTFSGERVTYTCWVRQGDARKFRDAGRFQTFREAAACAEALLAVDVSRGTDPAKPGRAA